MCNFVPGECIAFGQFSIFENRLPKNLLGDAKVLPLRHTEGPADSPFDKYAFMHVTGIPQGMEVETVSQLSAAFSGPVLQKAVAVELNYYLPTAMPRFTDRRNLELSEPALAWARAILASSGAAAPVYPSVAFIDSGIDPTHFPNRSLTALDFSNGASGTIVVGAHDNKGHGTRVARVLHESLPPGVPLISAKIADQDEQVTVLALCRAFAEVVALYNPAVINLSLAPLDDTFACPDGEEVRVPAFHSGILRRVLGMAPRSFVVMAAGNEGQTCNQRHVDSFVTNLVFAVAVGSRLKKTRYSASPAGEGASEITTYAFGGDDAESESGIGVFRDEKDSFGTSFAAPFVSASAYAAAVNCIVEGKALTRQNVLRRHHFQHAAGWYPYFLGQRPWDSSLWAL